MRSKNYKKNKKEPRKKQILESYQTDNLTRLVRTADAVLSSYIRRAFKLDNGLVPCFTCSAQGQVSEMQCGHFIPRANWSTRWLPDNCRPQCPTCNEVLMGNLKIFRQNLEHDLPGLPEQLERLKNEVYKPTLSDLRAIIEDLKGKAREIS